MSKSAPIFMQIFKEEYVLKKEDLIAKGLSEEQAKAVLELYNEEIKAYVPKADLDNANSENAALKSTIKDRDKQLKEIEKNVGDNEELKNQIAKLKKDNAEAAEKHNAEMRNLKIDNAVETALIKSRTKTTKAVRALLDMDKIDLDKEGNVTGITEQLKALVEGEATKYLFESSTPTLKGTQLGYGVDDTPDTSKMNYTELCAYMEANPGAEI